jgi:hypothetical protein
VAQASVRLRAAVFQGLKTDPSSRFRRMNYFAVVAERERRARRSLRTLGTHDEMGVTCFHVQGTGTIRLNRDDARSVDSGGATLRNGPWSLPRNSFMNARGLRNCLKLENGSLESGP